MCVTVIVLAYQYAGWLEPFIEWVAAYVLSAWNETLIFLAAYKVAKSSCSQPPPLWRVSTIIASLLRQRPNTSLYTSRKL